jgi:ankyrin repeat protein
MPLNIFRMIYNSTCELIEACKNNDTPLAKKLIKETPSLVFIPDAYGNTPLMYAILNNNIKLIQILLNHGACIKTQNILGDTPLLYALVLRNERIIRILEKIKRD